ncbi:hypothetical protein BH23BAC2_BH23BAC2_01710 [soil metagenome]
MKNLTERKKLEKAMEYYAEDCRLNQLLVEAKSEELADLNARLEQSEKELKQLNANKDKFLYIIAHDLKSPFNNLLGTAQFLENSYDQLQPEKIKKHIQNISMVAKNFQDILMDLLDWSSFQHGNMKFEPEEINLEEKIRKILDLLRGNAEEKDIDILIESCYEPIIMGDRKMVNSIIQNLVTNAIKFTCKGGTVAINLEKNESEILVKISDNGIGMDEETLKNLFQLHIHHSTVGTDNEKGTGLGLILCKEFVNKHGGKKYGWKVKKG